MIVETSLLPFTAVNPRFYYSCRGLSDTNYSVAGRFQHVSARRHDCILKET